MTYLYQTMTEHQAAEQARLMDRYDQLGGYEGIRALHDWYWELAEGSGEAIEVDIVGWCCDWTYYEVDELGCLADHFSDLVTDPEDEDDAVEQISQHTTVITLPSGGVLIHAY